MQNNLLVDKILILDLYNFIWRANINFKYNINNKDNVSDEFTTTFNFFRNLRAIVEQFKPTKLFAVSEGHPQFRYDLYADYKANRKIIKTGSQQENKDKFNSNRKIILELLKYLPVTIARASEYECDDVISSLVDNMKDEDITILSNDSDYLQILQKGYSNVKIYNPFKKEYMIAPEYHYVAWKALNGDKSDNIPGLVGDKLAQKIISDPKKFEEFLSIEENRAMFSINRQLIQFREVPVDEIIFEEGIANFSLLKEQFIKMKFESIVNEKFWQKFKKTFTYLKY